MKKISFKLGGFSNQFLTKPYYRDRDNKKNIYAPNELLRILSPTNRLLTSISGIFFLKERCCCILSSKE